MELEQALTENTAASYPREDREDGGPRVACIPVERVHPSESSLDRNELSPRVALVREEQQTRFEPALAPVHERVGAPEDPSTVVRLGRRHADVSVRGHDEDLVVCRCRVNGVVLVSAVQADAARLAASDNGFLLREGRPVLHVDPDVDATRHEEAPSLEPRGTLRANPHEAVEGLDIA